MLLSSKFVGKTTERNRFRPQNGTVQEQHAAAQREIAEKNAMLREMEARVHEGEELRKKLIELLNNEKEN